MLTGTMYISLTIPIIGVDIKGLTADNITIPSITLSTNTDTSPPLGDDGLPVRVRDPSVVVVRHMTHRNNVNISFPYQQRIQYFVPALTTAPYTVM